jgi:N6-adenosine-specific RNA methylase IME4
MTQSTYQVIVCDPPWKFSDNLTMSDIKRGAQSNYSTMSIEDLKKLPVAKLADPSGCLLALWCPSSLLKEGLDIMQAWSFKLKTTYVWVKSIKNPRATRDIGGNLSFGMGRTFRAAHELALIGINNTKIYQSLENKSQRSVSFAPNQGHSIKPERLQDSLDCMFPKANKLELFARRSRVGWTCLGNECPSSLGEDITTSIENLY